ncbi:unnamed protein product [Calypogeia fissa]
MPLCALQSRGAGWGFEFASILSVAHCPVRSSRVPCAPFAAALLSESISAVRISGQSNDRRRNIIRSLPRARFWLPLRLHASMPPCRRWLGVPFGAFQPPVPQQLEDCLRLESENVGRLKTTVDA